MFLQTHRSTLDHLDATSMVEHVYLNYIAKEGALDTKETLMRAKEQLYARHDETGFLTQKQFERFGVPYNFYKQDGIRQILKTLAAKYADELGYAPTNNTHWSTSEFRKRFPDRDLRTCAYCGLRPIDLHHMVPRETHPNLAYESENVVPLCVQAHGYISRAHWTRDEDSPLCQVDQGMARGPARIIKDGLVQGCHGANSRDHLWPRQQPPCLVRAAATFRILIFLQAYMIDPIGLRRSWTDE